MTVQPFSLLLQPDNLDQVVCNAWQSWPERENEFKTPVTNTGTVKLMAVKNFLPQLSSLLLP